MPPRTYEVRIMLMSGILQLYIDNEVTGIPIDTEALHSEEFRQRVGYVLDSLTVDNGVENDKLMRNREWMKLPDTYNIDEESCARDSYVKLRKIVVKKYLGQGDHWLRIKTIENRSEAVMDFIELVPLNIINDPTKPEDRH